MEYFGRIGNSEVFVARCISDFLENKKDIPLNPLCRIKIPFRKKKLSLSRHKRIFLPYVKIEKIGREFMFSDHSGELEVKESTFSDQIPFIINPWTLSQYEIWEGLHLPVITYQLKEDLCKYDFSVKDRQAQTHFSSEKIFET